VGVHDDGKPCRRLKIYLSCDIGASTGTVHQGTRHGVGNRIVEVSGFATTYSRMSFIVTDADDASLGINGTCETSYSSSAGTQP